MLQAADGWLYGTTAYGGAFGKGTVFRMSPAGELTTIATFSGTEGAGPFGELTLGIDGHYYGTTSHGGTNDVGTVFRLVMPMVKATLSGGNVIVSWPTNHVGFTLQTASQVDSLNWTDYLGTAATSNGDFVVTNAIAGAQFFRLKK